MKNEEIMRESEEGLRKTLRELYRKVAVSYLKRRAHPQQFNETKKMIARILTALANKRVAENG